jgi:DNA-binding LacI/PurR family transcriptional regulator
MRLLSREGLIVKKPKQGIFTASASSKGSYAKKHTLAVAVPSYPSSVFEQYLEELTSQVKRRGEVVEVIRYDWRSRIVQTLPKKDIDALILVPTSGRLTPADFYGLSQYKVPVVMISRMIRDVAIDCVEPDNVMGGELAAEHLISLGIRSWRFYWPSRRACRSDSRIDGFTRRTAREGIEDVFLIDCETRPGENSAIKAYESLKAKINEKGLMFTGLFVLSEFDGVGGASGAARFEDFHSRPGQCGGIW